jgi:hypothetical protein
MMISNRSFKSLDGNLDIQSESQKEGQDPVSLKGRLDLLKRGAYRAFRANGCFRTTDCLPN